MKPTCGAKKGDGTACKLPAGYGTGHLGRGCCKFHFGSTRSHEDRAVMAEVMERAEKNGVMHRGDALEIHPHDALLEEVRRTAGRVKWLGVRLDEETDEVIATKLDRAFMEERTHLVKVCGVALHAGIEERTVRLAEQWGAELATVLGRIMDELELSPRQIAAAPQVIGRHLRQLESGTVETDVA